MPMVRGAMVAIAFTAGCNHQYLAIPGAHVVAGSPNYTYDAMFVGDVTPYALAVPP